MSQYIKPLIRIKSITNSIKVIHFFDKVRSKKKIVILTDIKINKKDIINFIISFFKLQTMKFQDLICNLKINSMLAKKKTINRKQYIKENSVYYNIYSKYNNYKKFIITFNNEEIKNLFIEATA